LIGPGCSSGSCAAGALGQDCGTMKSLRNLMLVGVCLAAVGVAEARTPKWEYLVVSAGLKNRNLEQMLNAQGALGWELVALTRKDVAIFKRVAR
jgi:hypothetical protein